MKALIPLLSIMIGMSAMTSCTSFKLPIPNTDKVVENKTVTAKLTAYTHTESDHKKYRKKTAAGTTLKVGKSIATDWSVFPVGTVLAINGKNYQVDDYGSALVKPDKAMPVIDIYKTSKYEMRKFGAKICDNVYVVKMGSYEESAEILKNRLKYKHCRVMYNRIQTQL